MTRYPLILRMLTSLGRVWVAAFVILVMMPLVYAYGQIFGIALLMSVTGAVTMAALLVLFLGVPLGWGLGCAGLILENLARHTPKRKRKRKREFRAEEGSLLADAGHWGVEKRLVESRQSRMKFSEFDLCRLRESEPETRGSPREWRSRG